MTRNTSSYSWVVSRPMVRTWLLLGMLTVILPVVLAAPPAAPAPATAAPAVSDPAAIDKQLIAEAKKDSEIMANLTYLSDMIGPRLTGSAALKKANDWGAEKMRAYGLSNVHLEGWEMPVAWERGTAYMRIVEPNIGRSLTVAAMAWTPGTKGKITGEVVVIQAREGKDLEKYKGKLKNAVVLRGEPSRVGPVTERSAGFGQRRAAVDEKGNRSKTGKKEAAKGDKKEGAKGDVPPPRGDYRASMAFRRELTDFLRKEGVAVLLMDSGKPHGLLNMTGSWRSQDRVNAADPLPSLFVAHEHYAQLYRLATRKGKSETGSPPKTMVEFEIDNKLIPGPHVIYNTVGEIVGSEKPDEFIVLGAHLDSWDLGQGTTDNGTGSCVLLETARIIAKSGIRPKRTIRFVLFTGEEQGLHGSREYVKAHKNEMAKTSMALVHDTGTGKVVGFYMQGREVVKPILEKELVSLKELGVTEYSMFPMNGTDHASFDDEKTNVPGFAFMQDPSEYRFTHHSQSDTLDKAHEADLIQGAQAMSVAGMRIANLPTMLPRDRAPGFGARRQRGDQKATPPAKSKTPAEKK